MSIKKDEMRIKEVTFTKETEAEDTKSLQQRCCGARVTPQRIRDEVTLTYGEGGKLAEEMIRGSNA